MGRDRQIAYRHLNRYGILRADFRSEAASSPLSSGEQNSAPLSLGCNPLFLVLFIFVTRTQDLGELKRWELNGTEGTMADCLFLPSQPPARG